MIDSQKLSRIITIMVTVIVTGINHHNNNFKKVRVTSFPYIGKRTEALNIYMDLFNSFARVAGIWVELAGLLQVTDQR